MEKHEEEEEEEEREREEKHEEEEEEEEERERESTCLEICGFMTIFKVLELALVLVLTSSHHTASISDNTDSSLPSSTVWTRQTE